MFTRTTALVLPLLASMLTAQKDGPLTDLIAEDRAWTATSYGLEYNGAPAHSLRIDVTTDQRNATLSICGGQPFESVVLMAGFESQGWSLRDAGIDGFLLVQEPLPVVAGKMDANGCFEMPLVLDGANFKDHPLYVQAMTSGGTLSQGVKFEFPQPETVEQPQNPERPELKYAPEFPDHIIELMHESRRIRIDAMAAEARRTQQKPTGSRR